MRLTIRIIALLCLASALGFANTWSGVLVDSKCYTSEERNVNPTDTQPWADRDGNLEIRYCHPKARTKSFAIVQTSGESLKLDSSGAAKAAELVRSASKKSNLLVVVTGERNQDTITVDSISTAR
jgi:hypothetical protein